MANVKRLPNVGQMFAYILGGVDKFDVVCSELSIISQILTQRIERRGGKQNAVRMFLFGRLKRENERENEKMLCYKEDRKSTEES